MAAFISLGVISAAVLALYVGYKGATYVGQRVSTLEIKADCVDKLVSFLDGGTLLQSAPAEHWTQLKLVCLKDKSAIEDPANNLTANKEGVAI